MRERAQQLPAVAIALLAGLAWWPAASALAWRGGLGDAAPAIGATAAALVGLWLWRSTSRDAFRAALAAGRCPDCKEPLRATHEHARPGALAGGLTTRACAACGFERADALTCTDCAT